MINDKKVIQKSLLPFHISWTAIFVGALIGFGLVFLLDCFGLAMDLSLFNTTNTGATVIAIGGVTGILVGLIVAMLAAGYAAGYLGRLHYPQRNLGILYGFTTWSLILILNALLAVPLNQYLLSQGVNFETAFPEVQTASATTTNNSAVTAAVNTSPKILAESTFIVFILFLIGAFFSCVGACWGMACKRENEHNNAP